MPIDCMRLLVGLISFDKVFKDHYSKKMIISRGTNNKYQIYYIQKPNEITGR